MLNAGRISSRMGDERGAFVLAGMAVLLTILFLGAFVVDLLIIERVGATLQRTADSAALAGKTYLNKVSPTEGTLEEWLLSKRAAMAFLRGNPMTFAGEDIQSGNVSARGTGIEDIYEPERSEYRFTHYEFKKVILSLERGLWWYDNHEAPAGKFLALETRDGMCPILPARAQEHCRLGQPNYVGANAVQVKIRLKNAPVILAAAAFGIRTLDNIERRAIAGPR